MDDIVSAMKKEDQNEHLSATCYLLSNLEVATSQLYAQANLE